MRKHTIAEVPLFAGLPANALSVLDNATLWQRIHQEQTLRSLSEIESDVFIPITCTLREQTVSPRGRLFILREVACLQPSGLTGLVAPHPPPPMSLVANADGLVAKINGRTVLASLDDLPELARRVAACCAAVTSELSDKAHEMATLNVRARVILHLWRLAHAGERETGELRVRNAPTHERIANHIATNREAVSRVYSSLVAQRILARSGRDLVVLDVAALKAQVELAAGAAWLTRFADRGARLPV